MWTEVTTYLLKIFRKKFKGEIEFKRDKEFDNFVNTGNIRRDSEFSDARIRCRSQNMANKAVTPAESPISVLPPEILQEVFKYLDLQSLKFSRQVCTSWNELIYSQPFFFNKICLVHNALGYEPQSSALVKTSNSKLVFKHLRLQRLFCSKHELSGSLDKLFLWMSGHNLTNITQLEIKSSQLLLKHLFLILNQFTHINHLIINDDTLIWNPFSSSTHSETEMLAHSDWIWFHGEKILKQLVKFHVNVKGLHELLFTLNEASLVNSLQNLQEFHLEGSLGPNGNLSTGSILVEILRQNHSSLKSLKLDAFPCQVYHRLNQNLTSYDARLRNELFVEFHNFCQLLKSDNSEMFTRLDFKQLQELSLNRFPIANMNDILVNEIFVPFLSKLTKLRKFSMSQLYFSNDSDCDNFVSIFPRTCQIKLISTHLHAPVLNANNIFSVLHPNHAILEYENAVALIEFENVKWKIIYLTWNSLKENALMQNHLSKLVRLKLSFVSFNIGDEELQFIIGGAEQLVELEFEFCNLEQLTDSGLTGLHRQICDRILIDKTYKINQSTDFVGFPLEKLRRLKSLQLSQVGPLVTDVSARLCFGNLFHLTKLIICQQPQMLTQDGIEHIANKRMDHFEYYGVTEL